MVLDVRREKIASFAGKRAKTGLGKFHKTYGFSMESPAHRRNPGGVHILAVVCI